MNAGYATPRGPSRDPSREYSRAMSFDAVGGGLCNPADALATTGYGGSPPMMGYQPRSNSFQSGWPGPPVLSPGTRSRSFLGTSYSNPGEAAYMGGGHNQYAQPQPFGYMGYGGDHAPPSRTPCYLIAACMGALALLLVLMTVFWHGMPGQYDCERNFQNFEVAWSKLQREYCCVHAGRGCMGDSGRPEFRPMEGPGFGQMQQEQMQPMMGSPAPAPLPETPVQAPPVAPVDYATGDQFCNPQVPIPQLQSAAFDLPPEWLERCHGQGPNPVVPPPGEDGSLPGEQNFCWNWMKDKGCKKEFSKLNWQDSQAKMASKGLAPPPGEAPIVPVRNPEQCQANDGAPVNAPADEVEAAKGWFAASVAVYVLSVTSETDRRAFIQGRLDLLGIPFTFIDGLDLRVGDIAATTQTLKADGVIPADFDMPQAMNVAGAGTVGIAAAHLGAMQKVLASGQQQPLALVLESDIFLEGDIEVKLQRLLRDEAPCDWETISLKSWCPYGQCVGPHLTRVEPDINTPASRCHHGANFCFFSMLYKMQTLDDVRVKLAQKVWDLSVPHCLDVDVALAAISDQVAYYAVPAWQFPGFLYQKWFGSGRTGDPSTQ